MADNEYFWVRAVKGIDHNGRVGEHQVLLFETDAAHPNGEAFIAGPIPVEVGDTLAVSTLLKDGAIEKVSAAEAKKAGASSDPLAADRAALDARQTELDLREKAVQAENEQLRAEIKRLQDAAAKK
jgi:hypothetical protein